MIIKNANVETLKPEIFSNFQPVLVTEDKSEIEFNKNFSRK